ncbi:MAG: hypothetical protein ABL883_01135 [Terricaulis sp.]
MYYQLDEEERDTRDSFEMFGELETQAAKDVQECVEEERPRPVAPAPAPVKSGFSWAAFAGGLAAFTWIGAAVGVPLSYFGIEAVLSMDPAVQAGLVALACGPALLFWVSASAAGEALKARRLATELTRLAQTPTLATEAGEAGARRLSETVKSEIESLNDAVATALARLAELEHSAQRNAALFNEAVAASREGGEELAQTMLRERDSMRELNGELRNETEVIAHSVGRQVRLMREASKLVNTEMGAAENALERHLAAFAASATTLSSNTSAFKHAAGDANAAAAALNGKVAGMLDGLSEATRLTDAARQSAEQAVAAAAETAHAVRESTRTAVTEAKRAAQLVREETIALQDVAGETLAKLSAAANAARDASEQSQAAADRHATSIEKRLSALAATAAVKKAAPSQKAERPAEQSVVANETTLEGVGDLQAAANSAASRWSQPRASQASGGETESSRLFKGFTSWNNFLPLAPTRGAPKPANESEAFNLVEFDAVDPDTMLKNEAIDLVADAGVDLDAVLIARDLERIAQSSRHGAAARRRAVVDAAPGAVSRVARHVKRNGDAQRLATQFRARPDLAKSERKGESSELVRAYLLIDAALS